MNYGKKSAQKQSAKLSSKRAKNRDSALPLLRPFWYAFSASSLSDLWQAVCMQSS